MPAVNIEALGRGVIHVRLCGVINVGEEGIQIQIEVLLTDEPEARLLALNGSLFRKLTRVANEG